MVSGSVAQGIEPGDAQAAGRANEYGVAACAQGAGAFAGVEIIPFGVLRQCGGRQQAKKKRK